MSPARLVTALAAVLLSVNVLTTEAQSPASPAAAAATTPAAAPSELGIKWVRDSEEYSALARQVYRAATDAVIGSAKTLKGTHWTVVLDVDETALDNSAYQLERAAYGLPFEGNSWAAWIRRRQAAAVPGTAAFVTAVRGAGGHVAWITNRTIVEDDATRENLRTVGLWSDDDRLCGQIDSGHTKRMRRDEVRSGSGACAWRGSPSRILAFVGDQMGDFPEAAEAPAGGGDDAFGRTSFLLPNPMYGGWSTRVTRVIR